MSVSYVNLATKEQRPNLSYPLFNQLRKLLLNIRQMRGNIKRILMNNIREGRLYWGKNGENSYPRLKKFLVEMEGGMVPVALWRQKDTGTTDQANKEIERILGRRIFDFPKPKELVMRIISLMINGDKGKDSFLLDFFSPSLRPLPTPLCS